MCTLFYTGIVWALSIDDNDKRIKATDSHIKQNVNAGKQMNASTDEGWGNKWADGKQ